MMVGPAIAWVFALVFQTLHAFSRTHRYLVFFATSYFLFGLGAASQILNLPRDWGWNTMLSALLYTASALTLGQGLLTRSERTLRVRWHVLSFTTILVPLYYFYYIDQSLIARIYILNFGIGLVLLLVAGKLRDLRRGATVDRVVWWALLLFAVHFFPRTLLTARAFGPAQMATFAESAFWFALQVMTTLSSVAFACVLLIAAPLHIIQTLKEDRDQDILTGLLNRRGFERRAKAEMAVGSGHTMTLVVCDLDHFKSINDTYGHSIGDEVLQQVARVLGGILRASDVVGRIGGEEFVFLLTQCDADNARTLVERVRLRLMQTRFVEREGLVTASFGLSERISGESLWDWFARTDIALYAAKNGGRNRIFVHDATTGIRDRTPNERKTA